MRVKSIVGIAVLAAFMSGCIPKPPESISPKPYKRVVQKGEMPKYKNMEFEAFMHSLPLSYSDEYIRKIILDCNSIVPTHKNICYSRSLEVISDFYEQIRREFDRYCIAKGGWLDDKMGDKALKYAYKTGMSYAQECKMHDGEPFFGYYGNNKGMAILTPAYFQLPFDVFKEDRYIDFAKRFKMGVVDVSNVYKINTDAKQYKMLRTYSAYGEEDSAYSFDIFVKRFVNRVLFPYNEDIIEYNPDYEDDPIYAKMVQLKKEATQIIKKDLKFAYKTIDLERRKYSEDGKSYQSVSLGYIYTDFFGTPLLMPTKAMMPDNKHAYIFKSQVWKKIFKDIVKDNEPLILEYKELIKKSNKSIKLPTNENFDY